MNVDDILQHICIFTEIFQTAKELLRTLGSNQLGHTTSSMLKGLRLDFELIRSYSPFGTCPKIQKNV